MYYPTLTEMSTTQDVIDTYTGYDHEPKIIEGAMYEMTNMSCDKYPLLATRDKRGIIRTGITPAGMLPKAKLAYIDGVKLYYDGVDMSVYTTGKFALTEGQKQMVSMGAYIVIFPDKVYFNTEDYDDCGYMEASWERPEDGSITYTMCALDGTAYENYAVGSTAPSDPESGDYWLDTSGTPHELKVYSAASSEWTAVATVYIKIEATGIGAGFSEDDAVTLAGLAAPETATSAVQEQISSLNGSQILYGKGDDYVIVIGTLDAVTTQDTGTVTMKRSVPKMDFVIEAQNRLWGCYYGVSEDDGSVLNEIYCCALGDFKNWRRYAGISTDSYTASVGSDGPWTGAITYQGYPTFFKERHLHKVYVSTSGAHQIVDAECNGVQSGCGGSLAVVGEYLYYRSRDGIYAYDGSTPSRAGNQLGRDPYYNAVGAGINGKYYVSMKDKDGAWHLFDLDTTAGTWCREDDTHAVYMARCNDDLYWLTEDGQLICAKGTEGTAEDSFNWSATTGMIGYGYVAKKYVSRFDIRMKLPVGSTAKVEIEYDSSGIWNNCGTLTGNNLRTYLLPVRPVRCDHFRIRMSGTGEVMIYSFAKVHETGSDV